MSAFLAAVPSSLVETDADIVRAHARDQCAVAEAGTAGALARPCTTDEVATVLRAAAAARVPVVPRGAGTGLAGGANAIDDCVILSLANMDRIVSIDDENLLAVVEPGVLNGDLKAAASRSGLWYPPDPASSDISTIGGNIATNAGGLCCVKYGTTRDYVLGLQAVLADGTVVRVGRQTIKGVVGLDLTALLVGSEGVLAVVTEATLRLVPRPSPPRTAVAYFESLHEAGSATSRLRAARLRPSMLEIMDRSTMLAVESFRSCGLDTSMAAVVLAQSDADGPAGVVEIERIATALEPSAAWVGWSTDPADSAAFVHARKLAFPAIERLGRVVLDDVVVPQSHVADMIEAIEQVAASTRTRIATFGHAGDGNLHPTIVDDDRHATRRAFSEIIAAAQRLGGSATGEHGVGSLKVPFVGAELDPASIRLQAGIKQVFDPHQRLNPGRALPATRQGG